MNVSVGERWERYIEELQKTGRYGSASEIVREGLRLVEERERKLQSLRDIIDSSIARDEWRTPEEVDAHLAKTFDRLRAEGF